MKKEDFSLKVKFYGTRGSIPICAREFQEFGGNTTCMQIRTPNPDAIGVLDAGTGIRNLGIDLYKGAIPKPKEIIIAFSHFHWDHIQGFPFFGPAYDPNLEVTLLAMGKDRDIMDLHEIFAVPMRPEYFPVPLDKMGAQFEFSVPDKISMQLNLTKVTATRHNHPGGAYGYRLERAGKIVTICTDVEHGDALDSGIIEIARDADLLIHEAQYTSEELESHRGWGHSSYDQAIEVARKAGVGKLVMTHHDPDHDDAFLNDMEKYCQSLFPNSFLAREGTEFTV